jgi:hypothetical protein
MEQKYVDITNERINDNPNLDSFAWQEHETHV